MQNVPDEHRHVVEQLLRERKDLQTRFEQMGNTYADQEDYDRLFMEMARVDEQLRSLGYS